MQVTQAEITADVANDANLQILTGGPLGQTLVERKSVEVSQPAIADRDQRVGGMEHHTLVSRPVEFPQDGWSHSPFCSGEQPIGDLEDLPMGQRANDQCHRSLPIAVFRRCPRRISSSQLRRSYDWFVELVRLNGRRWV